METAADKADYHAFIHGWRDVGGRILFSSVLLFPPLNSLMSKLLPYSSKNSAKYVCNACTTILHVSYVQGLVVP